MVSNKRRQERQPQQLRHRRLKLLTAMRLLHSLKYPKREIKTAQTSLLAGNTVIFLPDIAYHNEQGEIIASLRA